MRKKALAFFIIFMLGGLLLSAGAWHLPPVDVPSLAPGEIATPEMAERIEALQHERELREAVRHGNVRGLSWGLTLAQVALALVALDLLFHLVSGRPGPLQRAFNRVSRQTRRRAVRDE